MPKIERTERQVAVRGSYQPDLPGNGGRAIGEGIASLGNAISGLGAQQTEQEMFDAKMKVSEYTFREQMAQDQAIADYNPAVMPADQFGATYEQERAQRDQEFAGQFKNPRVRQYAMLHTQQARQSAAARTQNARQGFVQQENVGRVMAHTARVGSTITGDPDSVVEAHKALDGSIEAIPGLTPGQRNVLRARASKELWSQWIGKADEDQLRRGKADYERGVDAWSKQFQEEQRSEADDLGRVSAKYESGGRGVGFVSTGQGDPGGPSYGVHQLSAKDSMPAFLRSPEGQKYADRLKGSPWSPEFRAEYQRIAAEDGAGLAKAQKDFYTRTHYKPALEAAKRAGFDVEDRGVQEAIFSIGVQHGGAQKIIGSASAEGDARSQIRSLFQARTQYVAGLTSLPEDTKQSVLNRYVGEERDAGALAGRRIGVGTAQPQGALSTSPENESPDGTMPVPRQRMALPDRARIGDHAINEFTDLLPKIDKRLAELDAARAGREWVGGVLEGRTAFNPNDAEGRKFIDQTISATDIGKRVFTGDPEALIVAGQISDRIKYVPKPIYDGLKGLTEQQDPKLQALGWTTINNLYARNPNIFNVHGDDKTLIQQAEYVQRLSRLHGMDKALKIIAAEKDPDAKIARKADEKDVTKFLKSYEGATAESQIAKDMDEGWWPFSRPSLGYDHVQKSRAIADYRDMLKRHYEATGSEEKAKSYAISEFKQSYGVTMVMGERIMPYPPERFYPTVEGSHKYIEEDIKKEVGTYSPSAKMETVRLISDGQTARDAAQGKPTYKIRVERADGREEILPGRFHPDHKEPQAKVQDRFERARKGLAPQMTPEDTDAIRRGIKVPPAPRVPSVGGN